MLIAGAKSIGVIKCRIQTLTRANWRCVLHFDTTTTRKLIRAFSDVISSHITVLASIALALVPFTSVQADTLFSEDFEGIPTGDILQGSPAWNALMAKGWSQNDSQALFNGYVSAQIVAAPGGRTGNVLLMRYLETQWTTFDDTHNFALYRNFTPVPDYYERFWFYLHNPNTSLPSPVPALSKWHYMDHYGPLPNNTLEINGAGQLLVVNQGNVVHICPPGAGGYPGGDTSCNFLPNQGPNGVPSFDTWHCAEVHQGQGIVEMWLDGVLTVRYTNGVLSRPSYGSTMIYRQGANNLLRYEDDYVGATTRVGCGASGPAVPSPPEQMRLL